MAGHRLLIVEDDGATRRALGVLFARLGWEVQQASTLAEGMAVIELGNEPCCVALDLHLPDGPGEALLKRIRARALRTRVVVITGDVEPERLLALAELGPDAVVLKPMRVEDLWIGRCGVCGAAD